MKKQSTKVTKAIIGLMMSMGSQAFAKNPIVTSDTLLKNNLEAQTIQELIDEKILLKTNIRGRFELNDEKVAVILEASEDQELKHFVSWLKSIVGDDSEVNTQKPGGMVISSQDGGNAK
jgi:low affinity Fe/Cu permease